MINKTEKPIQQSLNIYHHSGRIWGTPDYYSCVLVDAKIFLKASTLSSYFVFLTQNSPTAENHEADENKIRRLIPCADDSHPLYVQEQGAKISKRGEVLSVYKQNAKLAESRLFETSQVAVFGNIQLSTQAMQQLMQHSIPLLFFTSGGWFYGIAQGLPHKNIELRMAQYKAAEDEQICLKLARGWVATKIENCRTMLLRNHTDLPNGATMELKNMVDAAKKTESIASLLGIEGTAARIYFSLFSGMLKIKADNTENSAWIFDFSGRNRRPPRDPVNAMLSWLYAVLAKEFTVTALSVGLEPYLGFYHQPRYGRPALALDLMEELPPFKVR